jgi:predicted nucleic acid-binding Zn ribbon protein
MPPSDSRQKVTWVQRFLTPALLVVAIVIVAIGWVNDAINWFLAVSLITLLVVALIERVLANQRHWWD